MRRIALTLALAGAGLAGCVSVGRPLPTTVAPPPTVLAQAADVPLVPVPPPPLSLPEGKAPAKPAPIAATPTSASPVAVPNTSPIIDSVLPPPTPTPTAAPGGMTARQLCETARNRFQHVDSYIARMIRREMVKGEMNPEEIMLFKFRREPWSVYFKWLGKEGQGREVVFVKGRHESKIHSLLAAGDIPFMAAGKRMSLSPDSILVKSATRHPITDAGIATGIEKVGEIVAALDRGDRKVGTLTVVGPVNRPEFDQPIYGVEHTLPPGLDPSMPRGGKRWYYFDPTMGLPMLITAKDERGQEVEYYRYDRVQLNVKLDDDDFDPDKIWAKSKEEKDGK